jgi:opacity protein-like surface antigen
MYRHVLSLLAGTMVAVALASTTSVTLAQDAEEGLEIVPSEEISLQEYNLRVSIFGGYKGLVDTNEGPDFGEDPNSGLSLSTSVVFDDNALHQLAYGAELEWNLEGYNNQELPISLVFAFQLSQSDGDEDLFGVRSGPIPSFAPHDRDEDLDIMELRLGIRGTFDLPVLNDFNRAHIYVGVGGVWARAEYDVEISGGGGSFSFDDTGDGFGYWIGGGVYWDVFNNITFGVDITYSKVRASGFGDATGFLPDGEDLDIGGLSIVATLGFKF